MNNERLVEVLEGMNELSSHIEYEPVEDLIYEFLRDRTPLTEKSYQKDLQAFFKFTKDYFNLPRFEKSRCYFEEIKRV